MGEGKVKYEAVFSQASFQFCGHIDEYLIAHTKHLALLYTQTRFGRGGHLLRRYEAGTLVEERSLPSAKSILVYYWRLWWGWHRELCRFCRGRKRVTAIFEAPLLAVGLALRPRVRHVFWQWDYFPGKGFTERLYNFVARIYSRACACYIPLTESIGRAMGCAEAKPLMLGVAPPTCLSDSDSKRILMVGQLRGGQGIEDVLDFIAAHPQYSLSLMGAAAHGFEKVVEERIEAGKMRDRIYFPNHFVSEEELRKEAAKCFVAVALYDRAPNNLTHYADPGKVKSCIEMGLPVVMTRISDIVPFVERFKAGKVIDSVGDLSEAVDGIRANYAECQEGIRAFAAYFDFERYYAALDEAVACPVNEDLISYPHATRVDSTEDDQRGSVGAVYPFAARSEQASADLGRVRVLAQEVSAELMRTVQHGSGASVRETSLALVAAAKRVGCFVPYSDCAKFGDLKRRRSGESEVYAGVDFTILVKIKDPTAKAAIKRTTPDDWLYEHIIHNILFPETRYEFVGMTEAMGTVRIILRQKNIETASRPTEDKIRAALQERGLRQQDRYFYGNGLLAVTDVGEHSDNVLLGADNGVYFIDPLIRLEKPALDVIEALVGPQGNSV